MTEQWHQIFKAMPWGRAVTSVEMFERVSLPRGWTAYHVSQALRRLADRGDVERGPKVGNLTIFIRKTRLIGDPT